MQNSPLNVLFLIDSFRMGGAERITVALLPHLDRQRINPMVCTVTTKRESPLGEQLGNVPRFDLNAKRMIDPRVGRRLVKLIKEQQIDLIHAQLQDATILAAIAHQFTKVPVVVTRHLITDDAANWRRAQRNKLEQFAIRHTVAKIISVSDAAGEHYARMVNLPMSRFQTIYNGIDLEKFYLGQDKQTLRQKLDFLQDKPIVTMVGVMRPGKGQEVCIDAARLVPDAHFMLVGDGKPPYRAELEAHAVGLEDRLHFLGQRMDVPEILNASDMLILPSDNEALPTVLIEGGAAKLPVVATRVGGVPEIVNDGETGIIIPPQNPEALAEGIRRLINDPAQAVAMGKRAYQRVHGIFTLPAQAEQTTALYESVVRQSISS